MAKTFGHLFRVTTWGESHGGAIGAVVDKRREGCADSGVELPKRSPMCLAWSARDRDGSEPMEGVHYRVGGQRWLRPLYR